RLQVRRLFGAGVRPAPVLLELRLEVDARGLAESQRRMLLPDELRAAALRQRDLLWLGIGVERLVGRRDRLLRFLSVFGLRRLARILGLVRILRLLGFLGRGVLLLLGLLWLRRLR